MIQAHQSNTKHTYRMIYIYKMGENVYRMGENVYRMCENVYRMDESVYRMGDLIQNGFNVNTEWVRVLT